MSLRLEPGARAVVRAYRRAGVRALFHVWGRWRTCPFPDVAARVPTRGRVLDLGCGHGSFALYLADQAPARDVVGVDVDRAKLDAARAAAVALGGPPVRFEPVDSDWRPVPAWDAITVVDVLYLLGRDAALALVGAAARALAPAGVLLVKEIDVQPAWKRRLAHLQEVVATRVARVTKGDTVYFVSPAELAAACRAAGLSVEHVPLDRGRLHPHHLVIARAPGGPSPTLTG